MMQQTSWLLTKCSHLPPHTPHGVLFWLQNASTVGLGLPGFPVFQFPLIPPTARAPSKTANALLGGGFFRRLSSSVRRLDNQTRLPRCDWCSERIVPSGQRTMFVPRRRLWAAVPSRLVSPGDALSREILTCQQTTTTPAHQLLCLLQSLTQL